MPVLNIFRKKKKEEKPKKTAKETKKIEKEKPLKEKVPEKKTAAPKEKKEGAGWQILKAPQITEKATNLAEKNQYVFKVFRKANKSEIKKALENLYGVNVVSVNMINVRPKKRRLGRISGWRTGYKKAVVRIKEGQKIEVLPR
jgi:large subunit ribosomal protein L23